MPLIQFAGLASGIDSVALIDALIDARQTRNDIRRTEIERLETENSALDELNTKLLALSDLVDSFRTINGGGVNKKTASSNSAVATATAGSNALNTTHDITVTSLAKAGTASFNDTYASLSTALAPDASGTVSIGVDVGSGAELESIDINITSSTTVQQYITAFNAHANAAGRISASAVNVGTTSSPSYKVVFSSLNEGTELGTIAFDIPGTGSFGGQSNLQNRTVDQASNAQFSVLGISGTITRSSNTVSDVIPGVTLQLLSNGNADITVSNDADGTADQMTEIVEAYNDIVKYISENNLVSQVEDSRDGTIIYGSLAQTRVDDDFLSQFRIKLSQATSTSDGEIAGFAQMGLSTNRDGTISFDIDEFKEALALDPTGTGEILNSFADSVSGTSGLINQYTRFLGFIDVTQEANNSRVENINDAIEQLDRQLANTRTSLEGQFARLESNLGRLQNQQSQLSSILASL